MNAKYLLFWLIAGLWCKSMIIGFALMVVAVLLFEPSTPDEPAKKE